MMPRHGDYALAAGFCGSLASLFGKLSGDLNLLGIQDSFKLRAVFVVAMIASNVVMMRFFVKSLQGPGGSLSATVTSAATNFCCSAVFGCLFFGETTSFYWWCGTVLVVTGLLLITMSSNKTEAKKTNSESEKDMPKKQKTD